MLSVKRERERARLSGQPVLREKTFEILLETAKNVRPKKILEIGTNVGFTGIALLIENPFATLTGIEIDECLAKTAKENYNKFGVEDRAKLFVGNASDIVPALTGKYDFIFLDGPKGHYYEYLPYLKSALNAGGVLFADDVAFHGYITGDAPKKHNTIKRSIENFLQDLICDENFKTQINFDVEDGFCIAEKIK